MSLSFREQAVIALLACTRHDANERPYSLVESEAVTCAQDLADACCAKWGHDLPFQGCDLVDEEPDEQLKKERATCERCGKVIKP